MDKVKAYFKNMDSFRWLVCLYIVTFHVYFYWNNRSIQTLSEQLYNTNVNLRDGLEIEWKQIEAINILHDRIKYLENDSLHTIKNRPNK